MIERDAGRLNVTVPMTIANARGLLEAGRSALQSGAVQIDLSRVQLVDSSAVAVMLAWLRIADRAGVQVKFCAIPEAIGALADVYGIADLLPQA